MKNLRVANTKENREHLRSIGQDFNFMGKKLDITLNIHQKTFATSRKKLLLSLGFSAND